MPKAADNPIITIRHPRKREFFAALALAGETAQAVLGKAVDAYLARSHRRSTAQPPER